MMTDPAFNVWDGVYGSFAAAPRSGLGFAGATWRERSLQAARDGVAALERGEPLDYSLRQRNVVLPVAAGILLARLERLRVLDFGGGLGTSYLVLREAMPMVERVDYTVCEVESICETGRALYAPGKGPRFQTAFPDGAGFDLVHAASVLQYIEDWQGIVARLASLKPMLLSLADIFAGAFPAFVTLQTYYDSRIPHWFLNEAAFVREVERHGYRLLTRLPCNVRILGRDGPLPMGNFPPELRLTSTRHFLFGRSDDAP
jgi:putative methyltransferase (TIGR04325 family)